VAALGDSALAIVSALGGASLRARYASHGAKDLARGLVEVALSATESAVLAEAEILRSAALGNSFRAVSR
jgi:hypothetical protein